MQWSFQSLISLSAFLNIFISLQYFCLLRIETTTEQPAFNVSLSHLVSIQLLKMSYFRTRNYQQKFGKLFRNRKLLQNKQIKIILQKKDMEKDTWTMDVILWLSCQKSWTQQTVPPTVKMTLPGLARLFSFFSFYC